jgi:hypothetical protein
MFRTHADPVHPHNKRIQSIQASNHLPIYHHSISHLNPHLPKHERLSRMRHTLPPHLNLRIPLLLVPGHLDIVLQHHPRQYHLNLIRRKEAPGTSVSPVPEAQVRFVGGDELVARNICCFTRRTQFLGAETVESRGRGVVLTVEVDGGRGNFDYYARGDVLAV